MAESNNTENSVYRFTIEAIKGWSAAIAAADMVEDLGAARLVIKELINSIYASSKSEDAADSVLYDACVELDEKFENNAAAADGSLRKAVLTPTAPQH